MGERQNYYGLMLNFRSVQIRYFGHKPALWEWLKVKTVILVNIRCLCDNFRSAYQY